VEKGKGRGYVRLNMPDNLKPLKKLFEEIREKATFGLEQIASLDAPKFPKWRCSACGYLKHFTRPVTVEAAAPCKCGSVEMLLNEIKQNFNETYKGNTYIDGENMYDINRLSVNVLPTISGNTELTFYVFTFVIHPRGKLNPPGNDNTYVTLCEGTVTMPVNDNPIKEENGRFLHTLNVSSDFMGKEYLKGVLPGRFVPSTEEFRVLSVSPDFEKRMKAFTKGLNGLPVNIEGNYWRMLYFSAMTTTTVGYGDIVPITPFARFLAALQAISGIMLIGLFLNSLAFEANSKE